MQIVSNLDYLHEMLNAIFHGKILKNIITLSSAELTQSVVKVNMLNLPYDIRSGVDWTEQAHYAARCIKR